MKIIAGLVEAGELTEEDIEQALADWVVSECLEEDSNRRIKQWLERVKELAVMK